MEDDWKRMSECTGMAKAVRALRLWSAAALCASAEPAWIGTSKMQRLEQWQQTEQEKNPWRAETEGV